MRGCIVICFSCVIACGSSGQVPDGYDARQDDANDCQCPAADTLTADRVTRRPNTFTLGANAYFSLGMTCEGTEHLLGGGCMLAPFASESTLTHGGIDWDPYGWWCRWYTRTSPENNLTTTAVCLAEAEPTVPMPDSCDCPPVEPIQERISHIENGGTLASNSLYRLASSCGSGELLIGGGCEFEATGPESSRPTLISSGFDAGGTEWACTWKNPTAASFAATVTATCLRPPTPGTATEPEPLTDRIDIITQTTTLPASDAHVADVSCAPGDFLLWGSCTLDSPAAHPDVTMFRSGFLPPEQNRPNTWQCAWNNPADQTPAAVATAACLRPPASP